MGPTILSFYYWFRSLTCFIILGPAYIVAALFIPPHKLHPFGQWACRLFLRAGGQKIQLSGVFPNIEAGPYLYMFNHTSLLDTFVAIAILPEFTGAIGKKEQFSVPIWGTILRRWGAVPIDRYSLGNALQSLGKAETVLRMGRSLLIAPEGTRSPDGQLLPFKKGPFHLAVNTQTPIVLIAIVGAYESKRKGSWELSSGTIKISVSEPIDPREQTVDVLCQSTWLKMNGIVSS